MDGEEEGRVTDKGSSLRNGTQPAWLFTGWQVNCT